MRSTTELHVMSCESRGNEVEAETTVACTHQTTM